METINVKIENGVKKINGMRIAEIIENNFEHNSYFKDEKQFIINTFRIIESQKDLINELIKYKNQFTPVSLLLIIKSFGNLSISEANPILEKVLYDEEKS